MGAIKNAWDALKYGQQLADSVFWKNHQLATNALVGLLGAILAIAKVAGINLPISNADLVSLAGGIVTCVGLYNTYITAATTTKVGLPTNSQPPDGLPYKLEPSGDIPDDTPPTIDKTLMG